MISPLATLRKKAIYPKYMVYKFQPLSGHDPQLQRWGGTFSGGQPTLGRKRKKRHGTCGGNGQIKLMWTYYISNQGSKKKVRSKYMAQNHKSIFGNFWNATMLLSSPTQCKQGMTSFFIANSPCGCPVVSPTRIKCLRTKHHQHDVSKTKQMMWFHTSFDSTAFDFSQNVFHPISFEITTNALQKVGLSISRVN